MVPSSKLGVSAGMDGHNCTEVDTGEVRGSICCVFGLMQRAEEQRGLLQASSGCARFCWLVRWVLLG